MTDDVQHSFHKGDYWPPDFGWGVGGELDPMHNGAALVPMEWHGETFYSTHRDALGLWQVFFTLLVPHIEGGLNTAKTGSYNPASKLPDGSRSFHTWGIAMDVNWDVNHMGQNIPDAHGQHAVPRRYATELAPLLGLEWGGNWLDGYHDNMHFEIHLPPDVARQIKPLHLDHDSPFPLRAGDVIGLMVDPSENVHGGVTWKERLIVQHVQRRLHTLGFLKEERISSKFMVPTMHAVLRWQIESGRKDTGVIDHADWHALHQPYPGHNQPKPGGHK